MPKVSVIIPSYNRAEYLPEAINSVLAQTYRDFEIIVVDDGSTDDTREALEPFGDRIRYFYQEHGGVSSARNRGIREARGEFIAFLDSDDLWFPEKLRVQLEYMKDHANYFMCNCGYGVIGEDSRSIRFSGQTREEYSGDFALKHIFTHPFLNISSILLKKIAFGRVGVFDETLQTAEDIDIYLRIARSFPVGFIDLPLVKYRKHCGNISNDICVAVCRLRVLKKFLKEEPEFSEENKAAVKKVFLDEHMSYAFRLLEVRDFGKAASHLLWSFYYDGPKKRESIAFLKIFIKRLLGPYYTFLLR